MDCPEGVDPEYPLYPELPEEGAEQVQNLVNRFKGELIKVAEATISDMYCDVTPHVESDHWMNYRNHMEAGLIWRPEAIGQHRFKELRDKIYEEHKEEFEKQIQCERIDELNKRIESMKSYIKHMKSYIKQQNERIDNLIKSRSEMTELRGKAVLEASELRQELEQLKSTSLEK